LKLLRRSGCAGGGCWEGGKWWPSITAVRVGGGVANASASFCASAWLCGNQNGQETLKQVRRGKKKAKWNHGQLFEHKFAIAVKNYNYCLVMCLDLIIMIQ